MPILGVIASSILKAIQDLFNRTTSGSLGTADTGQTWQATRGVWFANGSAAQSNDSASSYPIASIPLSQNITVSATVTEGTGVSYWVTDANNWYATIAYRTQTPYSCNCDTCCNTCTHTGGSCGSTTTCNTCTHTGGSCGSTTICATCTHTGGSCGSYCPSGYLCSGLCWTAGPCSGSVIGSAQGVTCTDQDCTACGTTTTPNTCTNADCTACGSTTTANTCTNADCAACGSYSCNCQTCYTNSYWMRTLKSVSGTVSQVISDYSVASLPVAIKVITSSGTLTEYAYSDSAMTTLLGNTSASPSSPLTGNGVGIIKAPAAVSQGSTVDTFNAS